MTLFLLLISTRIDWFSVEQLEDFKHEQNVNGSNGLFPPFSTAACFFPSFPPSLTPLVRVVAPTEVENVLSRASPSVSHVEFSAVPTEDSTKLTDLVKCLYKKSEALDIKYVFSSLPLPVRNIRYPVRLSK